MAAFQKVHGSSIEPPPAKRSRVFDEGKVESNEDTRAASSQTVRATVKTTRPAKCSDFTVTRLEDFYKTNPPFRQPVEIGSFSFDSEGRQVLDRRGLRSYYPAGKLGVDLKVGYKQYTPKLSQTPDLTHILTWMSYNWGCFLPHGKGHSSVGGESDAGNSSSVPSNSAATTSSSISFSSSTAITTEENNEQSRFQDRPDNLFTNFISWRGLLTKLLCTPYNKTEPWKMAATLYNGTIYLREIQTIEGKEREANMSQREKELCYWGLKFEDYMTSKAEMTGGRTVHERPGTVNPHEAFCTVVRTRLHTHSIVMAAEVDCADQGSKEKSPNNYVELKTSRCIYTDRNKASFRRYKLQKWWAQSYLVGVPRIVCGFRDDDGIIQNLQTFRTMDIPRECQNDLTIWQACVCLNFLDELLKWVRETVLEDDPSVVYIMEWNKPFTFIFANIQSASAENTVVPDWFINKEPPPSPLLSPPPPPPLPFPQ